ncbi:MAG: TraU family protein (plasmid) [Candidatus Symbiodolus clandestinus]
MLHRKRWLLPLLWLFSLSIPAEPGCQSADLLGPKLITDFCWSCLFPIRVSGISISGPDGNFPDEAVRRPICSCPDNLGVHRVGITTSMWEPARLIEFQRIPGCASVLNGTRMPFNRLFQGYHGDAEFDGGDGSFMHFHYYAFPVLTMLDLFVKPNCNPDGYMDLDIMYFSELDPTWNNSELAFFTNPEAAIVANPVAALACMTDAVSANLGKPQKGLFWCAGSWGCLYPLSGHQNGGKGVIRDTSLLTVRVLAALHRRGLSWKTMGDEALCKGILCPTLPKTQYKFSLTHPIPETEKGHKIGESTLRWGMSRTIPAIGQDPVYTIWRWNDCCNY